MCPLLADDREDVRAAAVFALGYARDSRAIEPLIDAIGDPSDLVRSEAVVALSLAIRCDLTTAKLTEGVAQRLRTKLESAIGVGQHFDGCYETVKASLQAFMDRMEGKPGMEVVVKTRPAGRLLTLFRHSVRGSHLKERFEGNIFDTG
jgi:hypothetical protein